MRNYRLIDNIVGWVCFAIAAFTYVSTIEPTASFWDCPEFITTGYKLEVGHPPGAPFFMLTANLFSQLASDPTQVARMVNTMSALMSAACIMFLFWSITHLVRNLVCDGSLLKGGNTAGPEKQISLSQLLTIQFSGVVGALAYCWSDTFWFSAVEGEVYAYSSLFTAVVFWLMLKWEDHADEPGSDRWLILIAYLTGISIGVHLLNLLCLPALVLIYYYKKAKNPTGLGSILAVAGSGVLVAAVLYGIVPGIVRMGGWFELIFVNGLSCSFNTGLYIYILLLVATVLWGIYETTVKRDERRMQASFLLSVTMLGIPFYGHGMQPIFCAIVILGAIFLALKVRVAEGKFTFGKSESGAKHLINARAMNTALLCALMIMVGYSSYAVIVIRSEANPPMDQNSPEDIFTLGSYLSRDQYGSRPLFFGQAYTSQVKIERNGDYCTAVVSEKDSVYHRVEKKTADEPDRYEGVRVDWELEYPSNQCMLFPRIYSRDHAQAYEDWLGGVKGHNVSYDRCGEMIQVKMPSQFDNLRFFFSYQVNFMYFRYFMWNFAGRQNDIQGNGELEHGNWISGIPFLDNLRLGDQSSLPTDLKENKGRNVFFCLPLLLGLFGLFWQVYRGDKGAQQFWVVFFLFFMTGLAIVLYLNQTPQQPRERDYAYAGSFYAYAIWIGMGVAAIIEFLKNRCKLDSVAVTAIVGVVCLCVPLQMVSQTWDDHDRSNRYMCRDFGQNYLQSLSQEGNPVIFTNGDNDTFPLWYNQETEGVRTDARVCNLSYLQTDWYIDQMRRPAYDSPSLPIPWKRIDYVEGTRESITIEPQAIEAVKSFCAGDTAKERALLGDNPYELKNILQRWVLSPNPEMQIIPTDSIVITIDKEAVRRSGMMLAGERYETVNAHGDTVVIDSIPDVMSISLRGRRSIIKSHLMMLVMLSEANWERPLYVATTVGQENYFTLGDYFVQEGLAHRITPFNTKKSGRTIDVDKMYDNVMHRFKFGGLDRPGLYIDETVMRMCWTHRRLCCSLAMELLRQGDKKRALEVAEKSIREMHPSNVPYTPSSFSSDLGYVLMACGKNAEGEDILEEVAAYCFEYIDYYLTLSGSRFESAKQELTYYSYWADSVLRTLGAFKSPKCEPLAMRYYALREKMATRGCNYDFGYE
ncbi:MAG: DUF2723 domain-containing protein [Bacteroidaceae bacterium]|nr:DUF2723 domain-containing protein [Bacteroidaceae bacterium]